MTVAERFASRCERVGACLIYRGPVRDKVRGYGSFRPGGRTAPTVYAHRFAYEQSYGPIPAGMFVCHRCDTPLCCEPGHLFLGSHQENMTDMVAKGRQKNRTHCMRGHAFTPENTRVLRTGQRQCRTCLRVVNRRHCKKWRERRRECAEAKL